MLAGAEVDAPTVVRVQQAQREGGTTQEHRRQEGQGVSTPKEKSTKGLIGGRQGDVIFRSPPPTRGV